MNKINCSDKVFVPRQVVKNASSLVSGTVMWNYLRPRQQIADGSVKKVHHQSDQPANRSELLGCWVAVKMTPYDSCYSYGQCVFVDAQVGINCQFATDCRHDRSPTLQLLLLLLLCVVLTGR